MKIVYFGTPLFAAEVLTFLLDHGLNIAAVVTRTDKPKGRSNKTTPTPVKEVALKHGLPVYQPDKVSSEEFHEQLDAFQADLFVVVAYGEILKQHVLDTPSKGCINLHASLLPKYRGAAPIQRCIMEGETESGVSIMHMVKKMDAGDVIKAVKVPIEPSTTFGDLERALCVVGSEALLSVIKEFEKGEITAEAQDESLVSFAPKIELEDCEIHWDRDAASIDRLIRGVDPYPGAWCTLHLGEERKRLKLFRSELLDLKAASKLSTEVCKEGLLVFTSTGTLLVRELQLEGKKRMAAADLMRGLNAFDLNF